jgi:hypothetical protein
MPENSFYIALAISVLFVCVLEFHFYFIFYRCRDIQYFAAVNVLNGGFFMQALATELGLPYIETSAATGGL